MIKSLHSSLGSLLLIFLFSHCQLASDNSDQRRSANGSTLFTKIDPEKSGIDFVNKLENEQEFNVFKYRNFYNGGGVAIGDINNDGLPDIYMTSNLGSNKLYLNKGDLKFEDITKKAGVEGTRAWSTGVVMIDINGDKLLDIYVCNAGNLEGKDRKNEFFINNGDLTFSEKAADYNLDEEGTTTHAAFFDYDKDGDLDVYILNNSFIPVTSLNHSNKRELRGDDWTKVPAKLRGGGDKLFRNDGDIFTDVSEESGIFGSLIGFGLGVTVGDVNEDNYPDIYVSNDFFERDYLYINQQDGTFTESIKEWTQHISQASMGADMADVNNDGKPDIFVTDMLPEEDQRLKQIIQFEGYDVYKFKLEQDFYHQYMQNTLQLNIGENRFAETAYFSGVAKTDWSWGALLFDMDNDGYKDIYVCNGIYHDLIDQDFINFFANDIIQKMVLTGKKEEMENIINKMPSVAIPNYAFQNNGDNTYSNNIADWGMDIPSFSNGAAYGDLDNDGDLDLVVNNVNQTAFLFENNSEKLNNNAFVRVKLEGERPNTYGVGSIVEIFSDDEILRQEFIPSRGFQSSIDYVMTIGVGEKNIDSLRVIWNNGKVQTLHSVAKNETITLSVQNAKDEFVSLSKTKKALFSEVENSLDAHQENFYVDFDYEGLISELISTEGPAVCVGDVNNDGNEDLFVGGAKGQAASILLHQGNGKIVKSENEDIINDNLYEDTSCTFLDADGDGDLDLFVASGGNEVDNKKYLGNRLYLNDGKGNFSTTSKKLPYYKDNVAVVAAYDFDADGDVDIFVGGRSVPGVYGVNPSHQLLENDGNGNFKDVLEKRAFHLKNYGMITDAIWEDMDQDGLKDLVIVGDWEAPMVFKNRKRRLTPLTTSMDKQSGWWNVVEAADLNGDGFTDLILGNEGENIPYRTSTDAPVKMYVNDFDNNGTVEQITTRSINGRDMPIAIKSVLTSQLVSLKKQNLAFSEYASKSIDDLFSPEIMKNTLQKQVTTSQSMVAMNDGKGNFSMQAMPSEAQLSCICDVIATDLNKDGVVDIITGGNNYALRPQYGRLDASFGGVFINSKTDSTKFDHYQKSGFFVEGEVKSMCTFSDQQKNNFVFVGVNNDSPKIFKIND